jgi:uncharacterized protein (DUF952 family)
MKFFVLGSLLLSQLSFAGGKYSDEAYVICDVESSKWTSVKKQGYLDIDPNSPDKFIHCARPSQLHSVMNKYFKGTTQYILVTHASKLGSILKYENDYPHLYGKLNLKDVEFSMVKAPDSKGYYDLPKIFSANSLRLSCGLVREDMCVGNVRWNCSEAYKVECTGHTGSFFEEDAEKILKQLDGIQIRY